MKHRSVLLVLGLLLAACTGAAGGKTAGDRVDDSWIHAKVKAELVGEGSSNINVEVYQGIVQLAGFVDSEFNRDTAGKTAASVRGVQRVSNKLVVQTAQRSAGQVVDDGVVATKVKASLNRNKTANGFQINVEVRHGVVLLSGFVESVQERDAALNTAGTVEGVIEVIDGMDVVMA